MIIQISSIDVNFFHWIRSFTNLHRTEAAFQVLLRRLKGSAQCLVAHWRRYRISMYIGATSLHSLRGATLRYEMLQETPLILGTFNILQPSPNLDLIVTTADYSSGRIFTKQIHKLTLQPNRALLPENPQNPKVRSSPPQYRAPGTMRRTAAARVILSLQWSDMQIMRLRVAKTGGIPASLKIRQVKQDQRTLILTSEPSLE